MLSTSASCWISTTAASMPSTEVPDMRPTTIMTCAVSACGPSEDARPAGKSFLERRADSSSDANSNVDTRPAGKSALDREADFWREAHASLLGAADAFEERQRAADEWVGAADRVFVARRRRWIGPLGIHQQLPLVAVLHS